MKNIHSLYPLLLAIVLAFSSCREVKEKGHISFNMELTGDAVMKSAIPEYELVAAIISIQDENGGIIYDKEYLELIRFGERYMTRSMELPSGKYRLTEFMLADASGKVAWATPVEGSALAHLVRDPLPQSFSIRAGETTNLDVQVIRIGDRPPGDFGYAEFFIEFVNRFCLQVDYRYACLFEGNDSTPDMPFPGVPPMEPLLTVWAGDQAQLEIPLHEGINHLSLPILNAYYALMVTGCWGDVVFEQKFSLDELLQFSCDPDRPGLVIENLPRPDILITPEGLEQPQIRQGIFGQVTIPSLEPDESGQYDVQPAIRDIYFFPYHMLDSLYMIAEQVNAPVDCYFPAGWIGQEPVAIVRSNSGGFFQVELESGQYVYMVRTPYGFYIDAYISSRRPGQVMVYPMEVTELSIHVIDCSRWM
jgi:hypothetical protein